MKKTIFNIFLTSIICAVTVTTVQANISENSLPTIATPYTDFCPSCGSYTYQYYCGGTYLKSETTECGMAAGCSVTLAVYTTATSCNSCGYTQNGNAEHTHVIHSVCNNEYEGCPYDIAVAEVK